ncbi:MAG TPA: hypothetical protein VKZ63_00325 [Kofleriaceae bacterium]|nr:hypothetical protein [Kofleriaceae bacterium]
MSESRVSHVRLHLRVPAADAPRARELERLAREALVRGVLEALDEAVM